jgi:hypothetical protein
MSHERAMAGNKNKSLGSRMQYVLYIPDLIMLIKVFSVTSVETVLIYITPRPFGHKYDESPRANKICRRGGGAWIVYTIKHSNGFPSNFGFSYSLQTNFCHLSSFKIIGVDLEWFISIYLYVFMHPIA